MSATYFRQDETYTTCPAKTSTPNVSSMHLSACATSMPNISVIERSTSAPILVSDASVADLQRDFKKYSPPKNETSQRSSTGSGSSARTSSRKGSPRISSRKASLRTSARKDSPITCACKNSPSFCDCIDSFRTCDCRDSPRNCVRRVSQRNFFKQDSPKCYCHQQSPRSCCCPESPTTGIVKESPRRRNWSPSHGKENQKKEMASKCGCIKELYFNDEIKKSGGPSPGGHGVNECPNNTILVRAVRSAGVMTKIEKDVKSCGNSVKGSGSLMDSTNATCEASASYYHNKLLATQQILKNKEDMIGVQADSLAVAEERIATLNERNNELKKELDRKTKEYTTLRKSAEQFVEKKDVCVVTERPMNQRDIVNTLKDNLCVIEDLYRECFYETAKQENLIEMLRSSYLDLRLMERQKADQIGRLQTVINRQKWSLDRCQDIALEVDGLKMEISNFLNNSTSTNNDSGMWERSEESYASAPGVQDDLQDVMEQLLRLQDILALGCTCGLYEENMQLKREVAGLEIKIGDLQGQLCDLQSTLASRNENDLKYKAEIESKDKELSLIKEQLIRSQEDSRNQCCTCDAVSVQIRHTKGLLDEKTSEMSQLQNENESLMNKIADLQEELKKADHIITENCKMRSEVTYLTKQVSLWRAQLDESKRRVHALENEFSRVQAKCAHIEACYREKASNVAELQAHLEEAHERGSTLCGEARRAVCAVRLWMRRMRDKHREQENIIKEKDTLIKALRQHLEEKQCQLQRASESENTTSCSKCLSSRDERSFCSKLGIIRAREQRPVPGTNEIPSCSSTTAPIRLIKKKQFADQRCKAWMCDAAIQKPVRRDAGSDASADRDVCGHEPRRHDVRHLCLALDRTPRDVSPTEELLLRVEKLSEALADGNRRWTRPRDPR